MNHPLNHTRYKLYKPFPNGCLIVFYPHYRKNNTWTIRIIAWMTLRTVVVMTENFPKQQSWMIFLDKKGQSSSLKILENASESIGIRTNWTSIDRLDHPPNGPLIAQGDGEANGFVERSGDAAASAMLGMLGILGGVWLWHTQPWIHENFW